MTQEIYFNSFQRKKIKCQFYDATLRLGIVKTYNNKITTTKKGVQIMAFPMKSN